MKVLVTGAAGFIGSHVVDALRARAADVLGIDSLDPGVHRILPSYLRSDVDYCFADLRYWQPDSRFEDVEVVVHLAALGGVSRAAREPANIIAANCLGTARLAEFARRWPRLIKVVVCSSFSVYGGNYTYVCRSCQTRTSSLRKTADLAKGIYEVTCHQCGAETDIQPITAEACPAPLETYGASKYMQELCFCGFEHCPVNVLRFSSVYGNRLRLEDGEATIIARLVAWIRSGCRPRLFEDGRQIRDWVHVQDVVDAILAVVDAASAPPIINVCSGIPTRLLEACEQISRAVQIPCRPEIVGSYRPGDMRHCLGDSVPLQELIGRRPISLAEGAALAFSETPNADHSIRSFSGAVASQTL